MLSQNFMLEQDPLSLERIRSVLVRLEDTIIFDLIERAQFAHNPRMYVSGAFSELKESGFEGSWLEWFLKEIETFHGPFHSKLSPALILTLNHPTAKARRYTRYGYRRCIASFPSYDDCHSPDEYPFTSGLPPPLLKPLDFPNILHPNDINANPSILSFYTRAIVPRITNHATLTLSASKHLNGIVGDEAFEDDGNYGSAATIDVEVLQAISKRVHYGIPPTLHSSRDGG